MADPLRDKVRSAATAAAKTITTSLIESGDLERFRNADGKTYNGVKLFSALTGLSEDDVRKAFDEAKARKR